ncbi:hypothetical protein PACID_05940 [Acidipropionibacterium acidipropionici ATCC 4875]|uniref:Uncharacterized protein n=1 Tax=Acidipropionibacterium acidipropionici (strain ATCC 4875 / DSM 20272 / JCM 6432 / NBRC 12425 / NCIMB 8070 / 4) TaxID=1171373 RepID=K7SGP6_ACIA4|nr:hypothetical protein PACID_05940 [Acidipropionibacterium acidipropionici ATCC 4875]
MGEYATDMQPPTTSCHRPAIPVWSDPLCRRASSRGSAHLWLNRC